MKSENRKIVLIVPPSHTHYVVPPIGLGYIATALRKQHFNDINIVDCLKDNLNLERLLKKLDELNPRVVGFQMFSYDFNFVKNGIISIKNKFPKCLIVVGGPHVSATGVLALEELVEADYGIVGEAEAGFPELMRYHINKHSIALSEIPGLIYKTKKKIMINSRAIISNLDELGFPAWDLIPPEEYPDNPQGGFYMNFPIAPISTTRGCPYHCTFCGSAVNMGSKLRFRNIELVLDEMEMLYSKHNVREFHIIDDMFNIKKKRVEAFCEGIKKRRLKISYTFPNGLRLNHLDMNILLKMKNSGAYAFNVGIESGSQRILDLMKKDLTLELIEEKVNLIVKAGLEPSGFFIIGFPGETEEDIKATITFAKKLKLKRAHFSNFLPLPGTEATRILLESKEIKPPDWNSLFYSKVPYAPVGISKKRLKALARYAYLSFHLRPSRLYKMIRDIRSFNHLKQTLIRAWDYLFKN